MTRRAAPAHPPVALTIATSDSGGGAGVQADLKTMEACGAFGTSVLCATTAQNTLGVESVHVLPVEEIDAQLDAVLSDFDVGAAKTGMLATAEVVEFVAERASEFPFPLVVDPVMVATSGDRLLEPAGEDAYEDLIANATLVTPNADEATVLTDIEIDGERAATRAGEALREIGADAALVKGGHVPGNRVADVLVTSEGTTTIAHPRVATEATHGSGCTLASAIAAELAQGAVLEDAVAEAIGLLGRAVRYPLDVGEGPGSVHHLVALRERAARARTIEEVAGCVEAFVERDVTPLVPEVGMNVVGATPYAETQSETAAVEGRITRTLSGVAPSHGVRLGASSHVARFLLAAREARPELRFALDHRFDERIERALGTLDGPIVEIEGPGADEGKRETVPRYPTGAANEREDAATTRAVRRAFGDQEGNTDAGESRGDNDSEAKHASEGTPVAAIDRNEIGREALGWIVAPDPDTLVERTIAVLDAFEGDGID